MISDERKLTSASLIPLEIDAASVLSLSKGVIFDTVVHNIEHTLSKRRTNPLPWKLTGMSLICDASRNKKYMQKLQKMQCVPSVICTEIYHSKLIITESGAMSTPGRKIIIPTVPRKRLTGIIVARSIDDLLHMEQKSITTAHFIQYKLLAYERIPTREIIHGPRLTSSTNEKVLKTVFDFELTQNNGFPRQLLPVAIISFSRQEGVDLCASIHNFLLLDEHKTFDKSYLVTSTNLELIRLREEQERREDEQAEAESTLYKEQRRQPFADLSKKSSDTVNARPPSLTVSESENIPRVPPLKLKLPTSDKSQKSPVASQRLEPKFECSLNLDRLDLSIFDISNHQEMFAEFKTKKLDKTNNRPTVPMKIKQKTIPISKPNDHQKALKRLNNGESKKSSPSSSPISPIEKTSKEKSRTNSSSTRTISIDTTITLSSENSITSASSISLERKSQNSKSSKDKHEKTTVTKKVKRPPLPTAYNCSLSITKIDLSLYNIDLPVIDKKTKKSSAKVQRKEKEPVSEPKSVNEQIAGDMINCDKDVLPIIDNSLIQSIDFPSSSIIDALVGNDPDPMAISPMEDLPSTLVSELLSEAEKNHQLQENPSIDSTPMDSTITNLLSESNNIYVAQSPDVPPLDDDPLLFSLDRSENLINEQQPTESADDCIIIVECSDGEDDDNDSKNLDHHEEKESQTSKTSNIDEKSESVQQSPMGPPINPTVTQPLSSAGSITDHRSSRSSSCSSLSTAFLHNQSPKSPLSLTKYFFPKSILNKQKQRKVSTSLSLANHKTTLVQLNPSESLVDPRLIYRLKTITTDLRWPSACTQCSISPHSPSLFNSPTQTIVFDPKLATNCLDPRRDSLKTAILNHLHHRLTILLPHLFVRYSFEMNKILFEQTKFSTNCSLHLEYLLQRIQMTEDEELPHFIHKNNEFQLSPQLVNMIFN